MRIGVVVDRLPPERLPAGLPAETLALQSPYAGIFALEQARALSRNEEVLLLAPMPYVFPLWRPLSPAAWRGYRRLARSVAEHAGPPAERFAFWPSLDFPIAHLLLLLDLPFRSLPPAARRKSPFQPARLLREVRLQARALGRALDAGPKPEMLHAHFCFPTGCATARAAAARRLPYLITVHETFFEERAAWPGLRREMYSALRGAARVIAVSSAMRGRILARFPDLAERIAVVPNGFDEEFFHPRAAVRGEGPARLAFVGDLIERKGLSILLEAARALLAGGLDFRLTVAGDGPLRGELERRAADLGARVRFAGPLSREGVARLLREEADILVLPSFDETFGCVLVEALASGVPAVATRCGGPQDIVTDAVGRLVPVGDARALAEAIGEVWRRRAEFPPERLAAYARERFSSAAVTAQLTALYREALHNHE